MIISASTDYREAARRKLPPFLFHYIDGGAYAEYTLKRNVEDLAGIALRQRVLKNMAELDLSTELFGEKLAMPVALAPVGLTGMYARRGEVQAAKAAAAKGIPFTLSTVSVCPIEEVAPAIDRRLIDAAISALARAKEHQRKLYCLVPLSRGSISSRETADYIGRSLASNNLAGNRLCFVFSEDILTHHTSQAMEFSRQMRTLGCEIGLEDFGGGLSSFSHLRSIYPSHVVLSRSLTRDLGGNRASTALLRAVQEITSDQRIHSIAEDVDNQETLEQLRDLGIDYAQGKAVAPNEPFEVWLEGAVMRTA